MVQGFSEGGRRERRDAASVDTHLTLEKERRSRLAEFRERKAAH